MKLATKLAAGAIMAGALIGGMALPANAVGTSAQTCPGGSAVGHSSTNGGADTNAVNCRDALKVAVRQHYSATGGKVYTTSWKISGNYVLTVKQANPGYPVLSADHYYVAGVAGMKPIFSE
ncbi:hypothetical protein HUN58_09670 [Curtobacterium sp. Csp1]|uniref:Uncharacterized protein n=1 Tax=Curtobacterium citreum TaxID=2036 RepID=A0ABT2HIZ8_9MICO|nr:MULTISPECIES: hypothetical protein [Curtobacterium]MCS6523103.1 hypothetical protein [Curtobacterium citreum]QKS12554.1 hypothetical protein HUN60_04955 [Curtobacterium sp. csp3]QKS20159.1 hypothetical protein HUN58_09670 [Curtobacterium sp. Csp1]TQJ26774.1 hypothetical protein FB462_0617 [Curtobacterium citreum]GGL82488.1 hypothetical protein GCM10009706_21330 [Curtobacterium citreum]